VVGYALSPIDLIPDPAPILGYLDDLILIPLGTALAVRLIPPDILAECRKKARIVTSEGKLMSIDGDSGRGSSMILFGRASHLFL